MHLRADWRIVEPLASVLAAIGLIVLVVFALRSDDETTRTTLQPLTANPRYFADGSGGPLYLSGSHTWANLVDMGTTNPPPPFDFGAYLDLLERHDHNFIRLWTFEQTQWAPDSGTILHVSPQPWLRTGPGIALDDQPRFDLTRFNPAYFNRLRARVLAAQARGIYVSIMLFEGWELQLSKKPFNWQTHPFNGANNVNGIDGDLDGDEVGTEIHTLENPAVTAVQEEYVRTVIDTVQDLDNVLFEIANESGGYSTDWQYSMIDLIKSYEEEKGGKRHPVGMTFQWVGGDNEALLESEADWISPRGSDYLENPPVADGHKVVLFDNDHVCGVCPGESFIWKSFFRGHNPIYMDPLTEDNPVFPNPGAAATYEDARAAMGRTLNLARQIDLTWMKPRTDLTSTAYALAEPGERYLVYQPDTGGFSVDLRGARSDFTSRWLDMATGEWAPGANVRGGRRVEVDPPDEGPAVLELERIALEDMQ